MKIPFRHWDYLPTAARKLRRDGSTVRLYCRTRRLNCVKRENRWIIDRGSIAALRVELGIGTH